MGSGVVLLLSVFWLQLDGWLLAFLRFPFTSAWEEAEEFYCELIKLHCKQTGSEPLADATC